jgi:hypothetical protein
MQAAGSSVKIRSTGRPATHRSGGSGQTVQQTPSPSGHPGTRMSGMTGPDDAFLAPDDALEDFDGNTVDPTPDEDEGPAEPPGDEADPPGAVGSEAGPG